MSKTSKVVDVAKLVKDALRSDSPGNVDGYLRDLHNDGSITRDQLKAGRQALRTEKQARGVDKHGFPHGYKK